MGQIYLHCLKLFLTIFILSSAQFSAAKSTGSEIFTKFLNEPNEVNYTSLIESDFDDNELSTLLNNDEIYTRLDECIKGGNVWCFKLTITNERLFSGADLTDMEISWAYFFDIKPLEFSKILISFGRYRPYVEQIILANDYYDDIEGQIELLKNRIQKAKIINNVEFRNECIDNLKVAIGYLEKISEKLNNNP